MKTLTTIYRGALILWVGVLVIGIYYLTTRVIPTYGLPFLLKIVLSLGAIGIIFRIGEAGIRNYLWRSNKVFRFLGYFAQDRLDFHGLWYGETLYKVREQGGGKKATPVPFSTTHEVRIDQDALSISVQPTPGRNFPMWRSISATIEDDVLRFLYHVNYSNRDDFPASLYGHEWVSPKKRTEQEEGKGKPIILHGGFGHCVGDQKPTYSGETLFIRKGYCSLLTPEDLPESFRQRELWNQLKAGTLK